MERNKKPIALLTNDDGIESLFLKTLAEAVEEYFEVVVAAPKSEQSWIGRAMSRRKTIAVEPMKHLPWKAFSIDGTPSDCINIALGNLLDHPPAVVLSGINIGYNTTLPLIYSSGTVAGAAEAAFWGIPSIAASQAIPDFMFEKVTHSNGDLPDEMLETLRHSARHAAKFAKDLITKSPTTNAIVHNLNYPAEVTSNSKMKQTVPARLGKLSFYGSDNKGKDYNFRFSHGTEHPIEKLSDREAIRQNCISHTVLDFSLLGS